MNQDTTCTYSYIVRHSRYQLPAFVPIKDDPRGTVTIVLNEGLARKVIYAYMQETCFWNALKKIIGLDDSLHDLLKCYFCPL